MNNNFLVHCYFFSDKLGGFKVIIDSQINFVFYRYWADNWERKTDNNIVNFTCSSQDGDLHL